MPDYTMRVSIDGTDITKYIAFGGLKWQRADVDAADSGRTLDGVMHRGRVATKVRIDVTCRPLTSVEASTVLNLIQPEYVSVQYYDPRDGLVTRKMYSNNNPASYLIKRHNEARSLWGGITFPLIEV